MTFKLLCITIQCVYVTSLWWIAFNSSQLLKQIQNSIQKCRRQTNKEIQLPLVPSPPSGREYSPWGHETSLWYGHAFVSQVHYGEPVCQGSPVWKIPHTINQRNTLHTSYHHNSMTGTSLLSHTNNTHNSHTRLASHHRLQTLYYIIKTTLTPWPFSPAVVSPPTSGTSLSTSISWSSSLMVTTVQIKYSTVYTRNAVTINNPTICAVSDSASEG